MKNFKFIRDIRENIKGSRLEHEITQSLRNLGTKQEEADYQEKKYACYFRPHIIACMKKQREISIKDLEKERSDTIYRAYYRDGGIQDQLREFTIFVLEYMDSMDDVETLKRSVTGPIHTAEHQLRMLKEKLKNLDMSIIEFKSILAIEPSGKDIAAFYDKIEYKKPEYKQLWDELHYLQKRVIEGKADEQDTERRLDLINKKAKNIESFFNENDKRLKEMESKLDINNPAMHTADIEREIKTGENLLSEIISMFDMGAALNRLANASLISGCSDEGIYDKQTLKTQAELVGEFLEKWRHS